MRPLRIAGLALATLALSSGVAHAAPGALDHSFDGDGKLVLPFALTPAHVLARPDGTIVVPSSESFTVVQLNRDGSLDRGFGGDGVAAADLGPGAAIGAALQPDGKVVVAGQAGSTAVAAARFNPNGSLDATFDPGGADGDGRKVYANLGLAVGAMVVQPDGRIVIAGATVMGITAVRLTPSGSLDGTAFDRAGDDNSDFVRAAALTPNGKVVVAGYSATSGSADYDMVVARFNPGGSIDKSLAGTGRIDLGPDDRDDLPAAVLVQPDGKIVVAGEARANGSRMSVTRVKVDGKLDTAFGEGGTATPDFVGQSYAAGAALQPDGKILVAGTTAAREFAVARLNPDGERDPGFGLDGKATIPFDGVALAYAAALQSDGKFVVAGLTVVGNPASVRTALARVLTAQSPGADVVERPAGERGAGEGPSVDRDPPVIGRVALTPRAFAVARRGTTAAVARGTSIRYSLSEPAAVTLRFQRATAGRRVGRSCRPIAAGSGGRPCRRYVTAGTLRRAGRNGPNRVPFSGRIGRRALRRGTYRLVVTAVDPAGNRSASRQAAFRIAG